MRILILHSRYLSGSLSGENRVVDDEARLLREAGHAVEVWQPSVDVGAPRLRTAADALWSRDAVGAVRELAARFRPDLAHVHSLYPRLSPAVLRALPRETGVAMTLHNFRLMCLPATYLRDGRVCEDCARKPPWPGVVHACYRGSRSASAVLAGSLVVHRLLSTFDRVDRFLAVSGFVRDKHVEAGLDPDRIDVKPNFSWPAERRTGPGGPLVFVGRVTPEKGLRTAIRALPPSLELVVVGDGPERAACAAEARGKPVTFLGEVSPDEVARIMSTARALLVPSTWYEGQPRAIVEAFAAGVPVVASAIGGLPELVEGGRNGRLAAPGDEHEWRAALELVADDEEAERLGGGAYETWRERFAPDVATRELEQAYSRVVAVG